MKIGIDKTAMTRVRAAISYALTEAMDKGIAACLRMSSCCLPKSCSRCRLNSSASHSISNLAEGIIIADSVGKTRCVFLAGLHQAAWHRRAHGGRRCDGDERAGQGLGVHGASARRATG